MNIGATVTVDRIRRVFTFTAAVIILGVIASALIGYDIRLGDAVFFIILMTFVYWRITRRATSPVVDRRTRRREMSRDADRRTTFS